MNSRLTPPLSRHSHGRITEWLPVQVCTVLTLLFLASCVHYDPGYKELLPQAEANPPENAIVGMWHRKHTDGWGLTTKESAYFKTDHTGYWEYLFTDSGTHVERSGRLKWSYCGNGVWNVVWEPKMATSELRMAGQKLLFKQGASFHMVMSRVSE